ncbi:MAG TPA: hypothetical protein ENI95_08225 [Chloroflexi bacterium]|nr:hypothetical protein [Chloroflexota bacterium]
MSEQGELEHFRFMPQARNLRGVFRALWGLIGVASVVVGLMAIIVLALRFREGGVSGRDGLLALGITLLILFFIYRALLSACATYVTSSDIALSDAGVHLSLTKRRSRLIPWEAIGDDAVREVRPRPMFRPLRQDVRAFAVHAPGLPLLHRLTGLYYGVGFKPVFIVHSDHDRYQVLIERLMLRRGSAPSE